jgi:collagenase-like PrtC family protease
MKYYSLPADFKKETIDAYDKLNKEYDDSKVIETYGSITVGIFLGSGRLVRQMPKIDIYDLEEYIAYSKEKDMDFNFTLNATHFQNREFTEEGISEMKEFLGKIYNAGVRSLTITLPSMFELVKSTNLDFRVRTSTLCQIDNAAKAIVYKNMGVDKIVVDESINKDFGALKNIREVFGDKVEVIANQICDKNCMYRMFHYNMIAGDSSGSTNKVGVNYYEHRCVMQQLKSIDNLLKLCWIRPEDVKHYAAIGVNYFKLQGRHTFVQGGDPVKTVKCYFDERFDGNLMDLLSMFANLTSFQVYVDNRSLDGFLKPFIEDDDFCRNNCHKCDYCEVFAKKCIDYNKAEEIVDLSKEFYNDYDQYKNILERNASGEKDAASEDPKKKENPGGGILMLDEKNTDDGDFGFE